MKIHFNNLAPILTLGPSIAVLPFAGIGDRGPQRRIADEIAEAIVLNLSRLHWLHVISRNLSVAYKNKLMDVRQIGQELNVRYVLGGRAYLLGDQIKITTELIDTTTGYQIWARSFEPKFASDTPKFETTSLHMSPEPSKPGFTLRRPYRRGANARGISTPGNVLCERSPSSIRDRGPIGPPHAATS